MSELPALKTLHRHAPDYKPRVAVLLGSGWGAFTQHVQNAVRIPYATLDGFPKATVAGHAGDVVLGNIGNKAVAVLSGRKHGYETGDVDGMKTPLRVLRAMGCEVLLQTNAAGSLRADMPPHSLMAIADHINFPQRSPLVGVPGTERFVSMVNAYDAELRAQAIAIAAHRGVALAEGVYGWAFGPQFETPAEIRMMAQLGAHAVGMSTVPETILARHVGMRVLALSLITNMGAGLSHETLSHAHTLEQANAGSARACQTLLDIVENLQFSPNTPPNEAAP